MTELGSRGPGELYWEAMDILAENPICRMCGEMNGPVNEEGWCQHCQAAWEEGLHANGKNS